MSVACSTCKIVLNSSEQLDIHRRGKRHRSHASLIGDAPTDSDGRALEEVSDTQTHVQPKRQRRNTGASAAATEPVPASVLSSPTASSARASDVEAAVTAVRAIVFSLCPVLAEHTYERMWEDYRPSVAHLNEQQGRLKWGQDILRYPVTLPYRFVQGISVAAIVSSARDAMALNPPPGLSGQQIKELRVERLFHRIFPEFEQRFSVLQILKAVRAAVDLHDGLLIPYFLGTNRQFVHAGWLLRDFVKEHAATQRFQPASLAADYFEPLVSRTLDDADIASRLERVTMAVRARLVGNMHDSGASSESEIDGSCRSIHYRQASSDERYGDIDDADYDDDDEIDDGYEY